MSDPHQPHPWAQDPTGGSEPPAVDGEPPRPIDPAYQQWAPPPPAVDGQPAPQTYGYEQPPAGYGQHAPQGHGYEQPQAPAHGYDQPPTGYGYEQPPAGYGQPAPQGYGYEQQAPAYGYDQPPAGHGYEQHQAPAYGYEQAAPYAPPSNPAPPSGPGGWAPAAPGDVPHRWAPPPAAPVAPAAPSGYDAYLPPPVTHGADGSSSQYGMNLGYAVDIVFVIDITGSMTPVLDEVKAGAMTFHDRLMATMAEKDKHVSSLRVRVVAYRDYYDNPTDALFHTPFFRLPEDGPHLHHYLSAVTAGGGGDEPESGLEALGVAMASDWERGMDRRRHVVVVFTDASAHPLEASHTRPVPGYPTHVPNTFDGLTDQWDDPSGRLMEFSAKRLLLYAPDLYPWNRISASWDNVLHYPSAAGHGLNEIEFGQIIDAIAGSV
jgi:hypothetical protein